MMPAVGKSRVRWIWRVETILLLAGAFKLYSYAKFYQKWEAFERVNPDYAMLSKKDLDDAWRNYFAVHTEFNTWMWWTVKPQERK